MQGGSKVSKKSKNLKIGNFSRDPGALKISGKWRNRKRWKSRYKSRVCEKNVKTANSEKLCIWAETKGHSKLGRHKKIWQIERFPQKSRGGQHWVWENKSWKFFIFAHKKGSSKFCKSWKDLAKCTSQLKWSDGKKWIKYN